jgi:hypothetical protein
MAHFNRETERQYQQFLQEIRKKQNALKKTFKLPPAPGEQASTHRPARQ